MSLPLDGKICVVTGASGRIGRAIVERFLEVGGRVVAVDIIPGVMENVEDGKIFVCDQSDPKSVAELEVFLRSRYASIDVLVNNGALGGHRVPFHEKTIQEFDEVMAVNVKGPFLLSQMAVKIHLDGLDSESTSGQTLSIVNIASTAGHKAIDKASIYSTSKHALIGLTKNVAAEYAGRGVRCNSVSPGIMEVPNVQGITPGELQAMTSRVPMQRGGKPLEVARVVCFLASDEASYVTGTDFLVDGGYHA